MYLFGSDGSRWQRTFVLLESEIIPPYRHYSYIPSHHISSTAVFILFAGAAWAGVVSSDFFTFSPYGLCFCACGALATLVAVKAGTYSRHWRQLLLSRLLTRTENALSYSCNIRDPVALCALVDLSKGNSPLRQWHADYLGVEEF